MDTVVPLALTATPVTFILTKKLKTNETRLFTSVEVIEIEDLEAAVINSRLVSRIWLGLIRYLQTFKAHLHVNDKNRPKTLETH